MSGCLRLALPLPLRLPLGADFSELAADSLGAGAAFLAVTAFLVVAPFSPLRATGFLTLGATSLTFGAISLLSGAALAILGLSALFAGGSEGAAGSEAFRLRSTGAILEQEEQNPEGMKITCSRPDESQC